MEEKKPHKTIKQLLDEAGLQPTNTDWENMQSMLDKQLPVSGGKTNPFTSWHTWLITTGVVITGITGYFLVKNFSNGKKDIVTHQTEQVQPVNKPDAAKDSAAIFLRKEGNSIGGNQQPDVAGGTLNDGHKSGTSTDANATNNDTSTSQITNGSTSANITIQQSNKKSTLNNNTSNQNNPDKQASQHITPAAYNPKQLSNSDLVVNRHNATSAKNSRINRGKNNKAPGQYLVTIDNGKQEQPSYTKERKPVISSVTDNQNSNNKQTTAKNNKTNDTLSVGIDTAAQSPSLIKNGVNGNTDITKQSSGKKVDTTQISTTQGQTAAKNAVQKNNSRRGSGSKPGNNDASNSSGFTVGLQLSPLQLNLNGSKKVDINYVPAVHAQYSFNRIGVGVTVFPFVTNSTSQENIYTHIDTTFSTDTLFGHRTITTSEYYAQKITSYKAAVNVGYQLSDKILLEAGVGVQHLTSLKSSIHQTIQRDTFPVLITANNNVTLKSTDSVFKQSTQNTGFFFFNAWYTVKQWQFGVGYSQNGKAWLKNTNSKGASQLQLNIRYLFDFRKGK